MKFILLILIVLVVANASNIRVKKEFTPDYRLKIDYLGSCKDFKKNGNVFISNFKNGDCLPILNGDGNPDKNDLYAQVHFIKRNKRRCSIYVDQVFEKEESIQEGEKDSYRVVDDGFILSFIPNGPFRATVQPKYEEDEEGGNKESRRVRRSTLLFEEDDEEEEESQKERALQQVQAPPAPVIQAPPVPVVQAPPAPVIQAPPAQSQKPKRPKKQLIRYYRRPSCTTTSVICNNPDTLVNSCTDAPVATKRGYVLNKRDRIYITVDGDQANTCFRDGKNQQNCCSYVAPSSIHGICPREAPVSIYKLKLPKYRPHHKNQQQNQNQDE